MKAKIKSFWSTMKIVVFFAVIALISYCKPQIAETYDSVIEKVKGINEVSDFEVLKEVEETCRSMISKYEADKRVYEQYVNSMYADKNAWAEQARKRANSTAKEYNEYFKKNRHMWGNKVPTDIAMELEYLE